MLYFVRKFILMNILPLLLFSAFSILKSFTQEVDHNVEPGTFDTFEQYYFEENEFFDEENGTIILKIGAESPELQPSGVNDWFYDVAKIFHAKSNYPTTPIFWKIATI